VPRGLEQPAHRAKAFAHHADPEVAARALRDAEEASRAAREKANERWAFVYAGGRAMMGAGFIVSALMQAARFDDTAAALYDLGVGGPQLVLGLIIALQLSCGAMLAAGYKSRGAALTLLTYLAVGALAFHRDLAVELNRAFLLADLALAGGLLLLASHGSGPASLDRVLERRDAQRFGG
jgi:putative oxidoreductase